MITINTSGTTSSSWPSTSASGPSSSSVSESSSSAGQSSSSGEVSCGRCQKRADAGACVDQGPAEDLRDECPDDATCATGRCDGRGDCGLVPDGHPGPGCVDAAHACNGAGVCILRPSTCPNGACEPGEDGVNCGPDCCDAQTSCDVTQGNDGGAWCRALAGAPHGWVRAADTSAACDHPTEVCHATAVCAGQTSCCTGLDTWTPGPCPNCCADTDCPSCTKCRNGLCVLQESSEDRKEECPSGVCRTGLCDGAGGCGWAAVDCGPCQACTGLGTCSPDDTQHADCPGCQKCSGGSCVPQGATEDLKDECSAGTCRTGLCSGSGECGFAGLSCGACHACVTMGVCSTVPTHADCPACQKCDNGACVPQDSSEDLKADCDDEGTCLTGLCDGAGQCGDSPGGWPGVNCLASSCSVCDGNAQCVAGCHAPVFCICPCVPAQYCGDTGSSLMDFGAMCWGQCGVDPECHSCF